MAQMPEMLSDLIGGKYKAKTLPGFTNMPDGEHYAQLADGKVLAYSYLTGEVADTLFDIKKTKFIRLDTIEGFVLSADLKYMLVYNNSHKIYRRSFTADWYIYNIQRSELKPLTESPAASPVFSPNGRYIAFSRDNNLYVHKLDFGTEVAVTTDGEVGKVINGTPDWLYEEEFSTTCLFAFSPDSKQLAFVRLDESQVEKFVWQEFLHGKYPADYSLKYPKAGEQNAKASAIVYDILYKSLKTISLQGNEDGYIPRIRWTKSADALALFALNRNQNKLEMYIANPRSAVAQLIYTEKSDDYCVDFEQIDEWQFLQDNSMIVVNETDGYRNVYLYSLNGQKQRQLTRGNYDVTQVYGYDEATSTLFFQAASKDPMTRYLYSLNVKKDKLVCLTEQVGTHRATFSATYKYMIDNYQSATHANCYTLYNAKGKKLRSLLDNKGVEDEFAKLHAARKRFFSFTSRSGDKLNAWIVLPDELEREQADNDRFEQALLSSATKYPVLQVQYSGPNSQQVLDVWKPDWEYFLAKEGIIVVCSDGRGTGARGKAWRALTYMNIGKLEAEDQVSTAMFMRSLPCVNTDKIGIWGWSYGGYMTICAMSEPEAVYCCGIAVAPVTDWELYDSAYTERFMRRPQENSNYENASLLGRAANLSGRLLLCHGLADDNVHCQQAWKYVDALVAAGKQFDMQIYPDDNHFLRKRSNYKHLYMRKWQFLQQWLVKGEK